MDFANYDIYFPHLGIGIEHLRNSISPFGFRIAFYGILIGIGMILGILVASLDYRRRGRNPDEIQDFALYAIIFSVLGARAYYVIFQWDYYSQHPAEILAIRNGGLAIYGGVLAAILCCAVFTRLRKLSFFDIADSGVLGLILGQAIGRWGNFFNAEAFGGYTDSLLAMRIRQSIVNPNMLGGDVMQHIRHIGGVDYIQVHPTFLYESCWNLLVFLLLLFFSRRKKFEGEIFFLYLGLYGLGRFFIEGLRADSLLFFGTGIAVSQALSLLLVLLSIVSIGVLWYNKTRSQAGV
ncbi:MAG: prolipoprotein diacylglyceryl transferase [Oribacterium sp.]